MGTFMPRLTNLQSWEFFIYKSIFENFYVIYKNSKYLNNIIINFNKFNKNYEKVFAEF